MKFRQVHLDFHTSEKIPDIGVDFSKDNFQSALKAGHVDSITVFSKCHHGLSYHPTEVGMMHPNLKYDLLAAQIEAAHEIGVKTPVYLSAGFDVYASWEHPEWLMRPTPDDAVSFDKPGYHFMCMNTPYLDYLMDQLEEAVRNYDGDAIFMDITIINPCFCRSCVKSRIAQGIDPYDDKAAWKHAEEVYVEYCRRVRETIDKVKPGLPVFHNGGHIHRGRRDFAHFNTHLEMESLPTGGWGYDNFPLSATYGTGLDMEYLGMTGKFHSEWGEFGGFKHPNALIYETSLSAAFGAKCSIGDQLHPRGKMDEATYALIGEAYAKLEEKESWLDGVSSVADIAFLSTEAVTNAMGGYPFGREDALINIYDGTVDKGVSRVLLEGKYLFDTIDCETDLSKYKLLILPDTVRLDDALTEKVNAFIKNGGKVLATGTSGLKVGSDEFAIDFGAKFVGKSKFEPVYMKPGFETGYKKSAFVIYAPSFDIEATDGKVIIEKENPYFNRTTINFSSHRQTPNDPSESFPAAVINENGAYIASALFTEYAQCGSLIAKRMLTGVIDMLLGEGKTVVTDLPAQGVITLRNQKAENRMILHALYASPVKRGDNIEIIEDIIPLYGTEFTVKLDRAPTRMYSAPDMTEIPFEYENGTLKFTAEKIYCHLMAVMEF